MDTGRWWWHLGSIGVLLSGTGTAVAAANSQGWSPWGRHMMWGSWGKREGDNVRVGGSQAHSSARAPLEDSTVHVNISKHSRHHWGAAITTRKEARMPHRAWKTAGLLLVLTAALVGGIQAQPQHEQHHPGGAQAPQPPPAETSPGVPAQPQQMQGMMERMQGMMERMQGMMERMQGMMGRGGTRDRGGMMGRQGMGTTAQEEDDDEERTRKHRRSVR